MQYGLDIIIIIKQYVAPLLRKPKQMAWLYALLSPITPLHGLFLTYREQQLRDITITSSVIRLRRALRDMFQNERIEIVHPQDYLNDAFIYLKNESKPRIEFDYLKEDSHTPEEYDYLNNEFNPDIDFVIRIPAELVGQQAKVKVFVDRYVMGGRRFIVEII